MKHQVTWTISSSGGGRSLHIDLGRQRLELLVARWRDPEFWNECGAAMDSLDCARELEAVLTGSADTEITS